MRGERELHLALNPPDLGSLTVHLTEHSGGSVSVAIHASSSEAHDLLQQQLPALRAGLEQRDVRVEYEHADACVIQQALLVPVEQDKIVKLTDGSREYLLDADTPLRAAEREIADAEASGDGTRIGLAHERLEAARRRALLARLTPGPQEAAAASVSVHASPDQQPPAGRAGGAFEATRTPRARRQSPPAA